MKNSPVTSLLAAATLFLVPAALSAQPAPADDDAPPPPRGPRWERFDVDADGKLDATERAAAEAAVRERLSANPRFVERADTDDDGVISDNEWAAAKTKFKEMREHRGEGRGPGPKGSRKDRPGHDPDFRRGYLLGKYDANGDHKLDEAERATLKADMEGRVRARMEKQLARLKAADTDGDGKFSDAEWAAAKESFRAEMKDRHPGMGRPGMPPPPPAE
ncbi:MAG: hypothetical protein RIS54_303 [Verrucomicrobiota bacterium]|jgi:hypothetical protein